MTNEDVDFDTWFDTLTVLVLDKAGIEFSCHESVRGDYDDGTDVHDVADSIIAEYTQ